MLRSINVATPHSVSSATSSLSSFVFMASLLFVPLCFSFYFVGSFGVFFLLCFFFMAFVSLLLGDGSRDL
jgi:hypothetical protein